MTGGALSEANVGDLEILKRGFRMKVVHVAVQGVGSSGGCLAQVADVAGCVDSGRDVRSRARLTGWVDAGRSWEKWDECGG